ncbi:MAG: bifunctional folylpolyglutamate synthase/dihydrofolate synthase [Clostridiales bacterium]|nr:bifunctional folylpolyglutamate synthase/dihydrofolate synthase [Clostridiales bacterium]
MTFDEAMAYMSSLEKFGSKLGLDSVAALSERMGGFHKKLRFVHVAGTNGKGSVCACLDRILAQAGYRVGRFTSPDLVAFNERIMVNGVPIQDGDLAKLAMEASRHAKDMVEAGEGHPTAFEISVAMAFKRFHDCGCDVAVMEVGLGGRLDATNIIENPLVSVITPIGYDHMDRLGGTLEEIAFEKAGIIKQGRPVASAWQEPSARAKIAEVCKAKGAFLKEVDRDSVELGAVEGWIQSFSYNKRKGLGIRLLGDHQAQNAALAIEAIDIIREEGLTVTEEALRAGLLSASWPCRFEVVNDNPAIVLDGAHNPHGAKSLANAISLYFPGKKAVFVMGVMADKDYSGILEELREQAKCFVTITAPSARALSAGDLASFIEKSAGLPAFPCEDIESALDKAVSLADENNVICMFGSLYYVGFARALIMGRRKNS